MIFLASLPWDGSRSCLLVRFPWLLMTFLLILSWELEIQDENWQRLEISSNNPRAIVATSLFIHPHHSCLTLPWYVPDFLQYPSWQGWCILSRYLHHRNQTQAHMYHLTTCRTVCHSSQYLFSGPKPFLKLHILIQSGYHRFPRPKLDTVIFYHCDETLWSRLLIKERVILGLGVQGVRVHNDIDNITTDGRHGGWSWKLRAEGSYWATIREQREKEQIRVVQVFKLLNSPPILPPTKPQFLSLPKQGHHLETRHSNVFVIQTTTSIILFSSSNPYFCDCSIIYLPPNPEFGINTGSWIRLVPRRQHEGDGGLGWFLGFFLVLRMLKISTLTFSGSFW